MKSTEKEGVNWQAGLAAACERLVHPEVTDAGERRRQGRLMGLLLAGPFLAATLAAQLLHGAVPAAMMLAAVCGLFALGWAGAVLLSLTGRRSLLEAPAFAAISIIIGAAIAGGGLLNSPLVLLLLVAPFETWWLARSRKTVVAGWWAAAGMLAFASLATLAGFGSAAEFADHLWLVPLAYLASVAQRYRTETPGEAGRLSDENFARLADAVIVRVGEKGTVERLSGPAETLFGVEPALLLGRGLFERLHVTDRVAFLAALDAVREGREGARLELRLRLSGRAGEAGAYRAFRFDMDAAAVRPEKVLVLIRDRSEVEALREALARANGQVESAEIAKGRFLASVSHELRTPLNAIIGFADMLTHEMFGSFRDPRQKEYTQLISDSGQHLLSVVNAILDVSKIDSGHYAIEPEPFCFSDALDMSFSVMRLQAEAKNISLGRSVDPAIGDICADRRAVQQILINLVSNAVKFTPDGGSIDVSAKRCGTMLVVRVSDNGIGMTQEELARVGHPFIQVGNAFARRHEGTGLGLSLVKGLVALHEGEMEIDSAPELGTVVTIRLPLAGPGRAAPVAAAEPAERVHAA